MLQNIFYVSIGAILGAIARFLISHYSNIATRGHWFPWGTFIVNIVGCLIIGFVLTWAPDPAHDHWRLFAATGFCGALTTFSTFSYESLELVRAGRVPAFAANILLTNIVCFLAVIVGVRLHSSR